MKSPTKNLGGNVENLLHRALKYRLMLFGLLVVSAYGYIGYQISMLSTAQPSTEVVTSELRSVRPRQIDQATINQLQKLQDNNVNVKTLFNDTRNNPFQE